MWLYQGPAFDGSDEVRRKERERDCHVDFADAAALVSRTLSLTAATLPSCWTRPSSEAEAMAATPFSKSNSGRRLTMTPDAAPEVGLKSASAD
jgi:hypothetical protein